MKNTHLHPLARVGIVLGLALAVWVPSQLRSADSTEPKLADQCRILKEQRQKTQEYTQSQSIQLNARLEAMNRAPREEKLELMAAVVSDLVEQQTSANARRTRMDNDLMAHMMQHLKMGSDSLAECPLMKAPEPKVGSTARP